MFKAMPALGRRLLTLEEYASGVLEGNRTVLARAITLVESSLADDQQLAQVLLARLLPHTGRSIRVGITGVPGSGKSTTIEALGCRLTGQGHRVAVLAVDPSSPISGGSILGDKTRMSRLSADPNTFIRPSPSGQTLGGVARKTRETMLLCEAAGYDVVLVETVGVGQSETAVAQMTDFFLVLLVPGSGDELQLMKRGLLELADLIVINKADGDQRARALQDAARIRQMVNALRSFGGRPVPVITCSALDGTGHDLLWEKVLEQHRRLSEAGDLRQLRSSQNVKWLWSLVEEGLHDALRNNPRARTAVEEAERQVREGSITAVHGSQTIFQTLGLGA